MSREKQQGIIRSTSTTGKLECLPKPTDCQFEPLVDHRYKSYIQKRNAKYQIDKSRFTMDTIDDPKPPLKAGIIAIYIPPGTTDKYVLLVSSYQDKDGNP